MGLVIDVTSVAQRPGVPVIPNPPVVVMNWRRSPVTAAHPDPNEQPGVTDMNSWSNAHPGAWQPPFRGGDGERSINVLIEAKGLGVPAGLGGVVTVE